MKTSTRLKDSLTRDKGMTDEGRKLKKETVNGD